MFSDRATIFTQGITAATAGLSSTVQAAALRTTCILTEISTRYMISDAGCTGRE